MSTTRASTPSTRSSCASDARPWAWTRRSARSRSTTARRLRYDRLLLATGAEPRLLSIPGEHLDGVLTCATSRTPTRCANGWTRGGSVVVVGAGWIGAEVAASARQRGLDVTVVDPATVPLERVLGAEVGAIYRDIHADHGVRMLLGTGVEAFEGSTAVERVRTSDGRVLECDFVVVGVGVRPRAELAALGGLYVRDGILVDEHLQTSMPGRVRRGRRRQDRPSVLRAARSGSSTGPTRCIRGRSPRATCSAGRERYDRVPYFFSDQYDVGMEYAGFARTWDRVVFRGDPASREFIAFWLPGIACSPG